MTHRIAALILAGLIGGGCNDPYLESRKALNEYNEACNRRNFERAIAMITRANLQTVEAMKQAQEWRELAERKPLVVTQECHRAHLETRNIWLGDGKIVTNDAGDVEK